MRQLFFQARVDSERQRISFEFMTGSEFELELQSVTTEDRQIKHASKMFRENDGRFRKSE